MQNQGRYTSLTPDEWDKRTKAFDAIASSCELCPRRCRINRLAGERGFCGAPDHLVIASIFANHSEETPISGLRGAGSVFFAHCTLKCVFCQNFQLSHLAKGDAYSPKDLAFKMLELQTAGCHNISLVTPTHFLPWIVRALKEAAELGLSIPVVFNSGGYELPSVLQLLDGIIDIYVLDMKYSSNIPAKRYSNAPGYVALCREALREMFRQTGPLRMDDDGIAIRGICVRHLVLPGNIPGARRILAYLTSTFRPEDIYVSLMGQYRPLHLAQKFPRINRVLKYAEYEPLRQEFSTSGFYGFYQEIRRLDHKYILFDMEKRKSEGLLD